MRILDDLKTLKLIGFEVIKSNAEQIAVNSKDNTMPMVVINDIGYLTPTPYQWYNIDDEIKRLQSISEDNVNRMKE